VIKDGDIVYTIVETMGDAGARAGACAPAHDTAVPLLGDDEGESAVASMEDQWQQEMNVYEAGTCASWKLHTYLWMVLCRIWVSSALQFTLLKNLIEG
jgi:hypothetical protein